MRLRDRRRRLGRSGHPRQGIKHSRVPHADDQSSRSPAAGSPAASIETVLAATDFSEPSGNAVRWAADVARAYGARLLAAHVVTPLTVPFEWTGPIEGVNDDRLSAARTRLEEQSANVAPVFGSRIS